MTKLVDRLQLALIKPRTIRAIVWFVSAGTMLYVAAIFWFGWQAAVRAFAALGLQTLLIGAIVSCSSYLWRFGRWEYLLRCFGYSIPRLQHLEIYLSGLALTATPGKTGETFRSALLVGQGVQMSHSLAAFLVDRASDVLGVCLLGALAAWIVGQHLAWVWTLSFAVMLLGSCAFARLLLHRSVSAWWCRRSRRLKWLPIRSGRAVLESWASVWGLSRVSVFSAVAMLAYGTQALVFAWFCHVAGVNVSVANCVLIFVQATLFGAATMLPGGLGAMEVALVLQLIERGVEDGVALSLAISIRLVTLWVGMSLGALSLLFLSKRDLEDEQGAPDR